MLLRVEWGPSLCPRGGKTEMVGRDFASSYYAGFLGMVLVSSCLGQLTCAQNASSMNIGALVAYNSLIGRVAKEAIDMAVADINKNSSVLPDTKLVLHMLDTNCSAFQGAVEAIELLKKDVVAVIGPQSSSVSHVVAHIGGATQVPFISYAATDPALSEFQYPFIFRIAHTDAVQMEAIASLIGFYGWREVVALYMDDDFGTNGAAALSDALVSVGARIVQKVAFLPDVSQITIGSTLTDLAAMQTRIFVVHIPQNVALRLFAEAKYLGMISAGYAWIISDALAGTLSATDFDVETFGALQGVIGTRGYYDKNSLQVKSFFSEWRNRSFESLQPHLYGLYAYDAVWFLAYALDGYLRNGLNITFKNAPFSQTELGNASELARLKVFDGGQSLRTQLLHTKFQGTTGLLELNAKGDLIRSGFEIVNMVGQELRVVGYWSNATQLSGSKPSSSLSASSDSLVSVDAPHTSFQVIWPGNVTETPRGWVLPKNGRPLKIAVPKKNDFKQFVSWSGNSSNSFSGFCIDVFQRAVKYLPYSVTYTFVSFGHIGTPVYDDMIEQLADKVYDAVVGDVTITTKRMEKVDFSQPYTESGLVVVVPVRNMHSNEWAFLRPFSTRMWFTTLGFFVFTGLVVWMLEHKVNKDFRGHPKKQVVTILWFTFSTLYFAQREKTKSTCGRLVIIIWLFVVLIITSSYTANLTSILTVQKLIPTIQGISSLQASNDPIGYQTGSFVKDYLISINIAKERLKPLSTMTDYTKALMQGPNGGGVAAIVDEVPYVQLFLSLHCDFTIAGQEFTKGGWGFAFPKDSELAVDMSTAILSMSESGEMQRIHDLWLSTTECDSTATQVESTQLDLGSFWGLFLITGLASISSLVIYTIRLLWLFVRRQQEGPETSSWSLSSRSAHFLKSFAAYVGEMHVSSSEKGGGSVHGSKKEKVKKSECVPHKDVQLLQCNGGGGAGSLSE